MNFYLPQAASNAPEVDWLLLALTLVSCAVLALVYGLIWIYMIRYRASSSFDRGPVSEKTYRVEIAWTTATLLVFFGLFVWGADLYVRLFQPPPNALRIFVVGKQWMWKIEHQGGQREINALHAPINRPVQLLMTSEDVIHDFSIPAFRVKHDVLPGRYETIWFQATKPGVYHLFCTQLCGMGHALMTGEIITMAQPDYENWLSSVGGADLSMAASGAALYNRFGCGGCHGGNGVGGDQAGSTVHAPALAGLYGAPVTLVDGSMVKADDQYIRDCIMQPEKRRVAGYPPVMPSFAGQIDEQQLLELIAYIKSLKGTLEP
jgi:cytochrome c oxidase subunit II